MDIMTEDEKYEYHKAIQTIARIVRARIDNKSTDITDGCIEVSYDLECEITNSNSTHVVMAIEAKE